MSAALITERVTAGALIRRHLRVSLDMEGIDYREHKGLFDSVFIVTANRDQWQRIVAWVRRVNGDAA